VQSLSKRVDGLQAQLLTYTGLDFTPGTIIASAP
jgi:hypothetical protein